MKSFPCIDDVPPLLKTSGWEWKRYNPTACDFWIGTDLDGSRWLTKLRGGFRGYRELVFARLAQRIGWSCQTSTFIELGDEAVRVFDKPEIERFHAAHWFMPEHPATACSTSCPMTLLINPSIPSINELETFPISNILDWAKSDFAALLFGAHEPSGCFVTQAHEFVIIDSELMFHSGPQPLKWSSWWNKSDGTPSIRGRHLALEVCHQIAAFTESELDAFLRIPEPVEFEHLWSIAPLLKASHCFAKEFARINGGHA